MRPLKKNMTQEVGTGFYNNEVLKYDKIIGKVGAAKQATLLNQVCFSAS